ncbi:hypothetical protein OUY22_22870 [Nonomuraea sp. MCN248]|uniref:SPOR domain-containing protein n=1 Tax=Nonomuraea corallina TaxID=2989783 RepID=A0ABT4SGK0_9ACTN|nr:hypothetical protein [Nonomuraea corallina]MDA0636274.1 hypothetical protein [Nonomuraea corallina]
MPVRLVVALVVTALAVLAAGAWLWSGREAPRPATLRAQPTSALYALVDSRQADPRPLTAAEVFTDATRTLGELRRQAVEEFADCADALWGVEAGGCTQALRATYAGEGAAGQFVILNLPDGRAADALVAALASDGFVRQAVAFDPARSRAEVRALGHYVTVSWAGVAPGAAAADLVRPLIDLDGLSAVVQSRVLDAT